MEPHSVRETQFWKLILRKKPKRYHFEPLSENTNSALIEDYIEKKLKIRKLKVKELKWQKLKDRESVLDFFLKYSIKQKDKNYVCPNHSTLLIKKLFRPQSQTHTHCNSLTLLTNQIKMLQNFTATFTSK